MALIQSRDTYLHVKHLRNNFAVQSLAILLMLTPSQIFAQNIGCYNAFEHLSRALFWEFDDLMFAHTAYFDDSGKKEDGTLVVGGYIASIRQWEEFEVAWRLTLAHKDIKEFKRAAFNACADYSSLYQARVCDCAFDARLAQDERQI
jgi:hypothetical protein